MHNPLLPLDPQIQAPAFFFENVRPTAPHACTHTRARTHTYTRATPGLCPQGPRRPAHTPPQYFRVLGPASLAGDWGWGVGAGSGLEDPCQDQAVPSAGQMLLSFSMFECPQVMEARAPQ